MNASEIKVALLSYCRFARQLHYVCTECSMPGNSLADVVASDGEKLIEYEVKISMGDLKADGKKSKHMIYDPTPIQWKENVGTKGNNKWTIRADPSHRWHADRLKIFLNEEDKSIGTWNGFATVEEAKQWIEEQCGGLSGGPNMMYYVIPHDLWENHKEKIEQAVPAVYGIITCRSVNYHSLEVVRKAKRLHKNEISQKQKATIVARMSSELAGLTSIYYHSQEHLTSFGKMIERKAELKDGIYE